MNPVPYPPTGKKPPECRATTSSSMMPVQNGGKPSPTSGTTRTAWSRTASFLEAAMAASGTAITTASTAE